MKQTCQNNDNTNNNNTKQQVTDAVDFDIDYYDTYKVVTLRRPQVKYVLYQCGTPDPSLLPTGAAEGVVQGMRSFEIPLRSVAVTDGTANAFLVRERERRRGQRRGEESGRGVEGGGRTHQCGGCLAVDGSANKPAHNC